MEIVELNLGFPMVHLRQEILMRAKVTAETLQINELTNTELTEQSP